MPLAASAASVGDAVGSEIASSRLRWLVLFLYGLQSICNAVLWITFAPVTAAAGWYFDTTDTGVNILSLTFMIVYLPGSIMAAWVFNRHGLRAGYRVAHAAPIPAHTFSPSSDQVRANTIWDI